MTYHVFDLQYVDPAQVKEFLNAMAKEGLVAGVYLWINRENGKKYVGSSVNLYSRFTRYFGLKRVHGIIGNALRKYGLDGFVLVLFLVPNATSPLVVALEQSLLDGCTCAYNITPTAGSCAGVKRSDETREKMSAAKKGTTHSGESKAKMSASHYNKGNPVHLIQVSASGLNHVLSFPNQRRTAEALGVHQATICYRLKNTFFYNGCDHFITSSLPSSLT